MGKWFVSQKNGFTLIELLVAISIIGVLSTMGLVLFSDSQVKARDAKRKSDLKNIRTALEAYYNDNGSYPVSNPSGYSGASWAHSSITGAVSPGNGSWQLLKNALEPKYLQQVPVDPVNTGGAPWSDAANNPPYSSYAYSSGGKHYNLVAHLENTNDPDRCGKKNYQWRQGSDGEALLSWCVAFRVGGYSDMIYSLIDE